MLSIIVTFYDEILYLRTALNSIRSQRIDGIQIIVVNDNPDKFSPTDLMELGVTSDIELIQHDRNLGLSEARNSGLKRAQGEFVGFLDADDYYTLGGLTHQLEQAQKTQADITHAQAYFSQLGNTRVQILPRDVAFFSKAKKVKTLASCPEAHFITSSWSSLYRRDFLTENDLWFDPEQTRFEDRLFVLHTLSRAGSIAFTGRPNRVWRRRVGSISVSKPTTDTILLQVQLLEKCLTHVRDEVSAGRLRPVFEKRELFNTVSRLIWDIDLIEAIVRGDDPAYADIERRISQLLGDQSFGHGIFVDHILRPISRVSNGTRKGTITQLAFFAIHKALREGDFAAAHARILECSTPTITHYPVAAKTQKRLILHLGLHKTGTTFVQHHLMAHRKALEKEGFLVPLTKHWNAEQATRPGANSGHQGLVQALHQNVEKNWTELTQEIAASQAGTVILSCENMSFPIDGSRDELITRLKTRLGHFEHVDIIILARRADAYIEASYRERVTNGVRATAQGLPGFIADHGEMLCDLPSLFTPFEVAFNTQVKIGDFDDLVDKDDLWPGFARLAGLPDDLEVLDVARYQTPDRAAIQTLHLLNTLIAEPNLRHKILRGWFSLHPTPAPDTSLISPQDRLKLLDMWQEKSGEYAKVRGYVPDLTTAQRALADEDWTPLEAMPAAHVQDMIALANQAAGHLFANGPKVSKPKRPFMRANAQDLSLTFRLRPWAATIVRKIQCVFR